MKTLLFGNGAVSLDAVSPYQNIDCAPEAAFDDLTHLAACLCQTPVALLLLLDSKRWCLKSQVGIEPELIDAYLALSAETILNLENWESRLLIVENTVAERQLATHELVVSSPIVQFYAAAPLVTSQGLILGLLAVFDRVPRSLSLSQQEGLAALSRQAIAQLELRKVAKTQQSPSKQKLQTSYNELTEKERISINTAIATSLVSQGNAQSLSDASQMRFFMLSPELMCVTSFEGCLRCVNPAFTKTLHYTDKQLLSQPFLDFVHPEDRAASQAEWDKLANGAESIRFENRYRCQDGSYKWLAWSAFRVVEEAAVYAIARDITQTKQQKATLLRRSRLSTLEADVGAVLVDKNGTLHLKLKRCTESIVQHLDALSAAIWTIDPSVVESQEAFPLNLQASTGQLLLAEPLPDGWQPLIQSVAQTQQANGDWVLTPGEKAGNAPASDELFLTGYPLMIESRLVGVMALHSQQPFSKIVHGVLRWVANAIATAIDRAWTREELLNRREALLFHLSSQIRNSLDLDTILNTAVTEIQNLLGVDCCQFLRNCSESEQFRLRVTHEARNPGLPSLLGEYLPPHLAHLTETICRLQKIQIDNVAEATELESQTRSHLVDWGITAGFVLPFKTHTGQLAAIVCSHYDGPHVWSEREVELLQAVVNQLALAIEQVDLFASTRAAILAAQTQARHLDLALRDLKQTESRLMQAEKMSSLGQMVAGIAHEINNPVSFITGNLCHATNYIEDLLELIDRYQHYYPNPVPEIQELVEEVDLEFLSEDLPKVLSSMQIGADRIREIVLSLRNFSRADEAEMQPVNLHEGIDNTLLILHNRLKPSGHKLGITIVKEYGNLPSVECYAGQLNQVFMNIISNAIDALEGEKEEACPVSPEALAPSPTIWIRTEMVDSERVAIRIRDNGPGISQSIVKRLFDPFFTTKPVGKGTGLGLSISYQIVVEKHRGMLKCISAPGQGTEFWIQIPIHPDASQTVNSNQRSVDFGSC
jgi:PAS domain S-box-containing protein